MQCGQVVVLVERPDQLALRHGVILAVHHVLFARPQQLHRRAGHLLGDQHGLAHVVVERAAPAEPAAEHLLVHVAFVGWQPRRRQNRGEGRFPVLRPAPDLALVGGVERGGVHRLHGRVVLVRIAVDRFDLLGRAGDGGLGVAVLIADEGLLGVEAGLEHLGDGGARDLGIRALVPNDRKRVERGLGLPPGIGDHRDAGVADLHDLLHTLHAGDLGGVEALHLAAEHRTILDRGVEHARQLDVDPVHHLAGGLVGGVEPLQRLAGNLPVLRVLELDFGRRLELGGGFGNLAKRRLAARRRVRNHAVRRRALGRRDLPLVGRGLDQHHASRRAALAHVFVRGADATAAAGRHVTPHALARDALARCRIFGRDFRPVALELLGDELGETGERALTHLGAGDADDDGVVRPDHDPSIDFRRAVRGADDVWTERDIHAEHEPATEGGGAHDEGATIYLRNVVHD